MTPVAVELWCIAAFLALGGLAVAIGRFSFGSPVVYLGSLAVALYAGGHGLLALLAGGMSSAITFPIGLPGIGAHFRVDALSAFFLVVINLGGAVASLYALGYGRHEQAPLRIVPYYPVFLGAMNLVLVADDAYGFLLAWECMSLASWALVVAHHREQGNLRAGLIYLVMASFGTLMLLLAFGLLAGVSGQFTFAAIRSATPSGMVAAVALVLTLIGTGSKAGLIPLHVWLPLAHPAAPSHVSALLSGVMTKVGIYGFIRIAFDLVHQPSSGFAIVVLVVASITAVLGILYALLQRDLKRLLAYSTVENVGIIFVGLGLALAFQANGMAAPAALAFTAALFHVFNHSLFKSLLFFGAGAVLTSTGERNMDRLGGLIHRMPRTAAAFLIGCAAISALPPLNGFASEWLMFQAILISPQLPPFGLKFVVPAVGALLALSAAFAATCFVKAYGITFLGRPRTPAAEQAREVDQFSVVAMLLLAALCFVAGVLPGFVLDVLAPVTQAITGARLPAQAMQPWLSLVPIAESRSAYNGVVVLTLLVVIGALTALLVRGFASGATRRSAIWDCGFPLASPSTQYGGSSFIMPIRRVFGAVVFHVREMVDMPRPGDVRAGRFQVRVFDPAWRFAYGPITRSVGMAAERLNGLQFLTIRRYLTLVFSALIVLLVVVAAWR